MAIALPDRIHASLHLAWAARGAPAAWVCRLLVKCGARDCRRGFSTPRDRVRAVAGQMRSAIALSQAFRSPIADAELLAGWADELDRVFDK